jgi:hypothetical protein
MQPTKKNHALETNDPRDMLKRVTTLKYLRTGFKNKINPNNIMLARIETTTISDASPKLRPPECILKEMPKHAIKMDARLSALEAFNLSNCPVLM